MDERVAPGRQTLAALRDLLTREQQARGEADQRYDGLFRRIPAIVHSLNARGQIIEVSDRWLAMMRYTRDEVLGHPSTDFLTPECRVDVVNRSLPAFMALGYAQNEPYQMVTRTGDIIEGLLSATAEYDDSGTIIRTLALVADITDLKRQEAALRTSEQERLELQQATIIAQEQSIRELSTPVLTIAPGVVVMPLIGSVNAARATHILETLLLHIEQQRSRILILDITGLHMIDAEIANLLILGTRAARLLGARAILTGIRPEVAQVLVHFNLHSNDILTFSSLQHGIEVALRPQKATPPQGRVLNAQPSEPR